MSREYISLNELFSSHVKRDISNAELNNALAQEQVAVNREVPEVKTVLQAQEKESYQSPFKQPSGFENRTWLVDIKNELSSEYYKDNISAIKRESTSPPNLSHKLNNIFLYCAVIGVLVFLLIFIVFAIIKKFSE